MIKGMDSQFIFTKDKAIGFLDTEMKKMAEEKLGMETEMDSMKGVDGVYTPNETRYIDYLYRKSENIKYMIHHLTNIKKLLMENELHEVRFIKEKDLKWT